MGETQQISIRAITHEDTHSVYEYALKNRMHLQAWEPLREESYFSHAGAEGRVFNMLSAMQSGNALHFVILHGQAVIGFINYTNIIRGPFMACHLGFSIDRDFEGKGYMFSALEQTLEYVKNELHLHRVMANYMPHNNKSEGLLARLNFKKEGYAEAYLKINGQWQDHVLTSLIF
ncbi:MAG: GNAT family N-acetyltransferase [Methylophilus sp.]|uniref:GNAT family N-acetyltransferase n=1 Tax=Methylophilus sp. TaxID=29541 RepID=UPI003F9FAE77